MVTDGGRGAAGLKTGPRSLSHGFDLLAAVRALEASGAARVRFRTSLLPAFPTGDVEDIVDGPDGPVVESAALSLFGPNGPLPASLADAIARSERRGGHGQRAFFDLFGDRLTRAFVDLLRLEWPSGAAVPPALTPQATALRALAGSADRIAGPSGLDQSLLASAGLLHQRPRSLHAAAALLAAVFGTRVGVRGLVGGWTNLDPADRARLSTTPSGTHLGNGAALGRAVWLQESGVTIELGPMTAQRFDGLAPGGAGHALLGALVRHILPAHTDIDCRIAIQAASLPTATLGGMTRLGWSSWLAARPGTATDQTVRFALRRVSVA